MNDKFLFKDKGNHVIETTMSGKSLLSYAKLNKGSAFNKDERDQLCLIGLLPHKIETIAEHTLRIIEQLKLFDDPFQKSIFLKSLLNTNEILYLRVISENFNELLPYIYTPHISQSVIQFSQQFRHSRGVYFCYEERDKIQDIVDNLTYQQLDLIVVTDGGGVLGIGDQGVGGMDISISKLNLYLCCGGISPYRSVAIYLDVGTNNSQLINNPMYLGWRHPRINEDNYNSFVDEIVYTMKKRYQNLFFHWEDFQAKQAYRHLDAYKESICGFNDDIQGTGIVAVSAIETAIKRLNIQSILSIKILVFGAGNAGCGIARNIRDFLIQSGVTEKEAKNQIYLVDRNGLIVEGLEEIRPSQLEFQRYDEQSKNLQGKPLLELVDTLSPMILIGCSAFAGAFSERVISSISRSHKNPIILPLSNPIEKIEATPKDILHWSEGRAYIATGSPFSPVEIHGKRVEIGQCNNIFAFPGLGFAAVFLKLTSISNSIFKVASSTISEFTLEKYPDSRLLVPLTEHTRKVSFEVSKSICLFALKNGLNNNPNVNENNYIKLLREFRWDIDYPTIKHVENL
ncbi:MAG TPA: oxaloacetate-decarboxylating malate dehydrogenase [Gammaproteobacteria bacterium]|nr:oxaloacetate-decarboxylating malate dehydrogenase [Gammaproteobacteria bacterium]